MKISGVYVILNKINKKIYIGSACNINTRWNTHKFSLRKGKHHSIYLQRSFDKYGEDAFLFYILEECNKENLIKNEQFYIDLLDPEYNISKNAGSCLGVKGTPESNKKKSDNNKFKGLFGKNNPTSKTIYQYSLDGFFIKEWGGAAEIERELGFNQANIKKVFYKNSDWTPYGFQWKREFLGNKIEEKKFRDRQTTRKKVGRFDENWNLLEEFSSVKEAKEKYGDISWSLSKEGRRRNGYFWKYI